MTARRHLKAARVLLFVQTGDGRAAFWRRAAGKEGDAQSAGRRRGWTRKVKGYV